MAPSWCRASLERPAQLRSALPHRTQPHARSPRAIGRSVIRDRQFEQLVAAGPLLTDGQQPPMIIALIGAGLGLISIVLVILAWRGRLAAAIALVVLRLLSAFTAVPAFLVSDVPTGPMIAAGFGIGLTVVGAALVLAGCGVPQWRVHDDRGRSERYAP
ncbi:MAG TPA: hypothetical protein VI094_16525 [Propionibacteriaceae bacterium]